MRVALDWAFSPGGDLSVGVALTAAAVPLWMHLSLMEECSGRVERALAATAAGTSPDARREMKLHAALAGSSIYTKAEATEIGAAWTKALELAESLDDAEYQLRALRGLQFFHVASNRYRVALEVAEKFHSLAAKRSDPNDRLIGERMIAASQYYFGDQRSARRHIERAGRWPRPQPSVSHHSFSGRPTDSGSRLPRADSVTAGISRAGDAHCWKLR